MFNSRGKQCAKASVTTAAVDRGDQNICPKIPDRGKQKLMPKLQRLPV